MARSGTHHLPCRDRHGSRRPPRRRDRPRVAPSEPAARCQSASRFANAFGRWRQAVSPLSAVRIGRCSCLSLAVAAPGADVNVAAPRPKVI
ncbi:hypothetical protein AUP68_17658 [Ilyonectria robusta]